MSTTEIEAPALRLPIFTAGECDELQETILRLHCLTTIFERLGEEDGIQFVEAVHYLLGPIEARLRDFEQLLENRRRELIRDDTQGNGFQHRGNRTHDVRD